MSTRACARRADRREPRLTLLSKPWRFALLAASISLSLTAAALWLLGEHEVERQREALEAEARRLSHEILERFTDVQARFGELDKLGTLLDLSVPGRFAAFADPFLEGAPMLRVLEWASEIGHEEREAVEGQLAAIAGHDNPLREFSFTGTQPAAARSRYVPVRLIYPLTGNEAALGLDLASDATRAATLEKAWQSGWPTASAPLRLVQRPDHLSYLVLVPLRRSDRREYLAAVVEPVSALSRDVLGGMRERLSLQIYDVTDTQRPLLLNDPDQGPKPAAAPLMLTRTGFAGRTLEISIAQTGALGPRFGEAGAWVLAAGLLLSFAAGACAKLLAGRSQAVRQLVAERTAELQESRLRLQQMFMATPNAMLIVAGDGRIEDANLQAETLFGRRHEELLALVVEDLMPARYRQNHRHQRDGYIGSERYGRIMPMSERGLFSILRSDGEEVPVSIGISPLEDGGRRRVIVSVSDQSAQFALTEKLRSERDLRQQSLDVLNNMLLALDIRGHVTMINRFGCEFLGQDESEVVGASLFGRFAPQPALAERSFFRILERLARGQTCCQTRAPIIASDGRVHTLDWRVSPLRGPAGQVIGCMASGLDVTEQLEAERTAMRFGSDLEATLNALPDLLLEFDAEGRYVHVHTARDELLAVPKERMLGRRVRDVAPREAAAQIERMIARALESRRAEAELMRFEIDGVEQWADVSASRKEVPGGEPTCILLVRDATKRVLAQRKAEQMRRIVLASGELLAFINADEVIEVANPAFAGTFRCPVGEPSGRRLQEMIGVEFHAMLAPMLHEALAGRTVLTSLDLGQGGEALTLEVELAPLRDGETVVGVVLSGHDITDRASEQQALEVYRDTLEREVGERTAALERTRARMAHTLDSSPVATFVLDEHCRVSHWNKACAMYFGIAPEQMVGTRDAWKAFYEEARPVMAQLIVEGRGAELQKAYRGACRPSALIAGAYEAEAFFPKLERWLFITAAPMLDPEGNCIGAIETLHDVTARKDAEAMMMRAREAAEGAARAKSEFLANMSHEIRTPLNGVIGLSQVGLRENVGRRAHHTFERIHQSAAHLLGLINDLLDFSKIESGKFTLANEAFSLAEMVDRALDITVPAALQKGIAVLVSEAPDLPLELSGDGLRLTQCLVNLIGNACKFTEKGSVRIDVREDGERLSLAVSDTGIGMTEGQLGRLFRPFEQADSSTTRRFGGTGLGLAITHQIVTMMGGEILVTSRLGEGSRFEIRVPLQAVSRASPSTAELPPAIALAGLGSGEMALLERELAMRGCVTRRADPADPRLGEGELLAAPGDLLAEAVEAGIDESRLVAVHDPGPAPRIGAIRWVRPLRVRCLAAELARLHEEPDPPPACRLEGVHVLAVDDNEVNRMVLSDLLRLEGARLQLASSGEQALRLVREADEDAFELALLDIEMPGMDGYMLARELRAIRPELALIGLTAHASQSDRARCLAAGMDGHLAKPFDIDRLVEAVQALLGRVRAGGEVQLAAREVCWRRSSGEEVVDMAVLVKRFRGREDFVRRLLGTALQANEGVSARIAEAVEQRDFDALQQLAHSIKGMSGNLCAAGVQRCAAEVERMARGHQGEAFAVAGALAEQVEELLLVLKRLLVS